MSVTEAVHAAYHMLFTCSCPCTHEEMLARGVIRSPECCFIYGMSEYSMLVGSLIIMLLIVISAELMLKKKREAQ
jgi:hypothetical protein